MSSSRIALGALVVLSLAGLLSACGTDATSPRQTPISERTLAWASGGGGIIATSDGGSTWARQESGTTAGLCAIAFADVLHGWAVGEKGTVVSTTDGGEHWSAQDSGTKHLLTSVTFVDPSHGWAGGNSGLILATSDGGATWRTQHTGRRQQQISDVVFADRESGWALVADDPPAPQVLLATVDGGEHWTTCEVGSVNGITDFDFWDDRQGWIVNDWGRFFSTDDGGVNWRRRAVRSPVGAATSSAAFPSRSRGWVFGYDGQAFATTDGGRHWVRQHTGVRQILGEAAFVDDLHAFILGINDPTSSVMPADPGAALLATNDGGEHWQKQVNPTGGLSDITCVRQR